MRTMPEDDSHLDEQLVRWRRVRSERADWSLAGRRGASSRSPSEPPPER